MGGVLLTAAAGQSKRAAGALFIAATLLLSPSTRAAEVATFSELADAIANNAPLIELSAEQFVLQGHLEIAHNCTIRCSADLDYVSVDQNGYHISIRAAEYHTIPI